METFKNNEKNNFDSKSFEYDSLNTVVDDIIDISKSVIVVELDIYNDDTYLTTYYIELNINKMNLTCNMDYEYQLSKDINRFFLNYYYKKNQFPTADEIRVAIENINYLIIQLHDYSKDSQYR